VCLLAFLFVSSACAGGYRLAPAPVAFAQHTPGVSWITPVSADDGVTLARWRAAVGEPIVQPAVHVSNASLDGLTIVSWNTALGYGDVSSLVDQVRRAHPHHGIVLLLQEAFREDRDLPAPSNDLAFASRIPCASNEREVDALARSLDLSVYYVPSMRNGAPGSTYEDRGNAILSSVPLEDLTAIELPFERQRRVAIAATIRGLTPAGDPWRLRVANAHLDNRVGISKAFIGSEYARTRQARGLVQALEGDDPLVLGGDFNTWFGFADAAFRETAQAFPQTVVTDRRRTFRGLMRLDHVFYRLPSGWNASVRRGESALGSDHHPLITDISF